MNRVFSFWPVGCRLCGCASEQSIEICSVCRQALPTIESACQRCAMELPSAVLACGRCLKTDPAYDRSLAAWTYQNPVTGLIQRFKFSGDLAAGRLLAELYAEHLESQLTGPRPELMIPVPLHWRRQWRRGFNQAELIARDLSGTLKIPWQSALQRTRHTPTQSELPARSRTGNVARAFRCRVNQVPKHVALIDDVMTTGATLNECARVVKRHGSQRVDIWVLARA